MKRPLLRRSTALLLLCLLIAGLALPAAAEAGPADIHIRSAEDLRSFVSKCSYDAWSVGRTVYLDRDISLLGVSDLSAPSFGGVFEGGGHKISGLEITGSTAPAGLFGVIATGGVVRGLTVEGLVTPSGSAVQIGGIVGVNHGAVTGCTFSGTVSGESLVGGICGECCADGIIDRCEVSGGVFSKRMTGGIAGSNSGTVTGCVNRAYVNTNTVDPTITLSELDLNALDALRELSSPDTYNLITDSGGIVGWSDGSVTACTNRGAVGYPHVGYNVGGIAGRSSGHIEDCVNFGSVCGRKDVGGIVGLAEPYVKLNLTESSTEQVRKQLETLSSLVNSTLNDASSGSAAISARLTAIGGCVDAARNSAKALTGGITDYAEQTVSEIDRVSAVLSACLPMLRSAGDDLAAAGAGLTEALGLLSDSLGKMDEAGTLPALRQGAEDLETASAILDTSIRQLASGLNALTGTVAPAEGLTEAEWSRIMYGYTDGDGEHVTGALEELQAGQRALVSDLRAIRDALEELAEGMEDGGVESLEETDGLLTRRDLYGLLADAAESQLAVRDALERICLSTELDGEAAQSGMEQIRNAVYTLAWGRPGDGGGAFHFLSAAMAAFSSAAGGADVGVGDLRAAVTALSGSAGDSTRALEGFSAALNYLSRQDPLHFDSPGDAVTESSDALYDSLRDLSDQLEQLNGESKSASDRLLQDIRSINSQFLLVMQTVLGLIDDAGSFSAEALIQDTSDEDIDAAYAGKLLRCVNSGCIAADIDAGGIAGSMMLYNELDPEGDEKITVSSAIHRTYELKCILQDCRNNGTVTGKRSNIGAVCGDAQLGVITGCEAYGRAQSESGDNVGGIAGHADNVIRACWARCSLGGRNYLGGIVGRGEEENSDLRVSGCRSLVEITDASQFSGAIAGTDAGSFTGNLFVSDTLAGLGRISVQGKAEPVDYAALLAEEGLPFLFRSFTLRFVAGDEEVSSRRFRFGDSFGADAFPPVPEVEGMYGVWDRDTLKDLRFDTTVRAVYHPSVTALASDVTRSDTRPVFFASGVFTDSGQLSVSPALADFTLEQSTVWARLRASGSTLLEQWTLSVPEDGASSHEVRYLPPRSARGTVEVYRQADGRWQRLETAAVGSYLCFTLPAGGSELSVISVAIPWWVWAIVGGLCASILALILALVIRRRPKAEQAEARQRKAEAEKKRRRALLLILLAVILLLASAGVLLLRFGNPAANQEIYYLLRSFAERSKMDMDLNVTVSGGDTDYRTDAALYMTDCAGKRLSCVTWQGVSVYYCDGALLLENGKAFPVADALPDHTRLLTGAAALYRTLDITVTEENGVLVYHTVAESPEAIETILGCVPLFARLQSTPDSIALDLIVRDGEVDRLEACWTVGERTVRVVIGLRASPREHTVPFEVQNAAAAGTWKNEEDSSDALTGLLTAWFELSGRTVLTADVSLNADCGPLLLDEDFTWQRSRSYEPTVHCLSRRERTLFYTDEAVCDASGLSLTLRDAALADVPLLTRLALNAVLLGDLRWEETADGVRCTAELNSDAMDRFAAVIAPEANLRDLDLTEGTVSLTLQNGRITDAEVQCSGMVRVVLSDVHAELTAVLRFNDAGSFPVVSAKVQDALSLNLP